MAIDRYGNHYRSWSEMKAEGIEIETMQEYVNEVRGFNDYDEPEPYDPADDPDYGREYPDDQDECVECGNWFAYDEFDDHGRCPDCAAAVNAA